jgi:Holliday junction DNA helicase RuvA
VALAILSALEPHDLHRAIATGDKAMVARANGVGPKLAQRIVNELKDKIGAVATGGPAGVGGIAVLPTGGFAADALSALQNLGFKPHEASIAVAAAEEELGDGASLDALVRLALRKAAK